MRVFIWTAGQCGFCICATKLMPLAQNCGLCSIPGTPRAAIAFCAVVARPDEKWGETPCAFVELKPGAEVSPEALIAHCRSELAHFKAPRTVVFGELPKTSTGKIQKFALRAQAKELA